ncbi:ubiquitin ligase [Cryptosporidium canis]|uniref:Ubiquitin ligase n=1 Tax=Cryptosporidium canis TaxID=195482 RepID=A0A9D5HVZ3_9CRYT|nr:ubiquitin ligase [Cryptosporidium canis]
MVTRLLKSRGPKDPEPAPPVPDLSSNFFTLFKELMRRNAEFSSGSVVPEPLLDRSLQAEQTLPENCLLSQNLTESIKIQIETERQSHSTLDWMYRHYDRSKNKASKQSITPEYRNNCDHRIVLNILINILVTNGMRISQSNILELITDRFEKELLFSRPSSPDQSRRRDRSKDLLQHPGSSVLGDPARPGAPPAPTPEPPPGHRRHKFSSSMNFVVPELQASENPVCSVGRSHSLLQGSSGSSPGGEPSGDTPQEVRHSRDYLRTSQNIVFWREVIYQIVDLLAEHSQDLFETHLGRHNQRSRNYPSDLDCSVLYLKGTDSSCNDKIRFLTDSLYREGSGVYASGEVVWFGHLLKYGITEALGSIVSYSLCSSDLLAGRLGRSEASISRFQTVAPGSSSRARRQLMYLLHENVVNLNLRVLKRMVGFGERFSEFSRGLFDLDVVAVGGGVSGQDSMHPVLEAHIMFSWLLSQLFVWANIDISGVLRDYLLSSVKESSLAQLSASIHPLILGNVVGNLLEYRSFEHYSLNVGSLTSQRSEWIDNLLRVLSGTEKRSVPTLERNLITRIIDSDMESIESLGHYWKTFHPKYKGLQLAVYSVIMHLFGVDEVPGFDSSKIAVLEMSLSISRKCCSQILSNWQAQSASEGQENMDLEQQAKVKERFIETTISRCRWIIENVPFNLCSRYRGPTIPQREEQEREDAHWRSDQDPLGTLRRDSEQAGSRGGKKNRRATDTNIIFSSNSHHIDMLKQLLSIRRRSSQQSFEQPMITSMGSFGVSSPGLGPSPGSVSLKLSRNNSDPLVLSSQPGSSGGVENHAQDRETGGERDSTLGEEICSSQVLDIYIHFIMHGPSSMQDLNKVIKTEIFSSLLKQIVLEQIYRMTSCHSRYKVSLQSFLRYEGWMHIRLAQLVMIFDFRFRSILELCLENRDGGDLVPPHLSPERSPFSREIFRYTGGIVNNIQEWITHIFDSEILRTSQLYQSITENDELWFDSSLRLVILYFMIASRRASDEIPLLRNITACIFPFIHNRRAVRDAPSPGLRGSPSLDGQISLGDSVTGLLIAELKPEDERSLVRVLQDQGYHIEQIIQGSRNDQEDTRIFLFVQRLSSLKVHSVPIFADEYKFGSFYRLGYNQDSSLLIFRLEEDGDAIPRSQDGQMLLYFQFLVRTESIDATETPESLSSDGFELESFIPLHRCASCGDSNSLTRNPVITRLDPPHNSQACGCTFIRLYSRKLRIDQVALTTTGGYRYLISRRSCLQSGGRLAVSSSSSAVKPGLGGLRNGESLSSSSSLSVSSSSSVILLDSLNRMNSIILNNSYIVRLKKRGWILFKTYLLMTLISRGSDRAIKERIISYTFGVLTAISEKIQSLRATEHAPGDEGANSSSNSGDGDCGDDDNKASTGGEEVCEELGLYVEDILNIFIYAIQLTCYSARLRRVEAESSQEERDQLPAEDGGSGGWGDISYSILIKFLKLHDGEQHTLKDLWTRNSKIESKISVLLTECIRQCTLKDLTTGTGDRENQSKSVNGESVMGTGVLDLQEIQEWILQLNEITQSKRDSSANIRNFSVTLPDLHLFPRSFLRCISSELINYNSAVQETDSKSKDTPVHQNSTLSPVTEPGFAIPGVGLAVGVRDLHPIGGTAAGNDVPSSFRDHPHSSIFIGALPSENFNTSIDGRIVQCTQASMGGGIVICRAPLTFRGLLSTGLSVPPNILSFRVLGVGRFGITVAPSNVLTMSLEEVFQRNDVVGLRPQPPSSSSSSPSNSQVYQLPENMFALEIPYAEGTVIDIRYGRPGGSVQRAGPDLGGYSSCCHLCGPGPAHHSLRGASVLDPVQEEKQHMV